MDFGLIYPSVKSRFNLGQDQGERVDNLHFALLARAYRRDRPVQDILSPKHLSDLGGRIRVRQTALFQLLLLQQSL